MDKIKNFFKRLFSGLTKQRKSGFSLIELLVVIGIIGVLAAVAIPAYRNYQKGADKTSIQASLNAVGKGALACLTDGGHGDCDEMGEIRVTCGANAECTGRNTAGTGNLCFDIGRPGHTSPETAGCVSVNVGTGAVATVVGSADETADCNKLPSVPECTTTPGTVTRTPATCPSGCTSARTAACGPGGGSGMIPTNQVDTSSNLHCGTGTFTLTPSQLPTCQGTNMASCSFTP